MDLIVSEEKKKKNDFGLSMPVQYLKGVGPARAIAFEQLGVHKVSDLLEYFPRDWNFAPAPSKICQIQPGQTATITGLVESMDYQSYRHPPIIRGYN